MDESAAIELAVRPLTLATAAGAQSAEASVSIARRFHVEARENVRRATRGLDRQKPLLARFLRRAQGDAFDLGFFAPTDCVRPSRRAVAHAELVAPDEYAGLPDELWPKEHISNSPMLELRTARAPKSWKRLYISSV